MICLIASLMAVGIAGALLAALLTPYEGLPAEKVAKALQRRRKIIQRTHKEQARAENSQAD